jgi:hypothetical protein
MGNSRHVALHGDDHRLGALGPDCAERIEKIRRSLKRSRSQAGAPGWKVQAPREIRSLAVEHGDPKILVILELVIRLAQSTERRNIDAVLHVHAIDADEKYAHRETIEGNGALVLGPNGRRADRRRLRLGDSRARSTSGCGGGADEREKVPTDDTGFKCFGGYCHGGSSSIGAVAFCHFRSAVAHASAARAEQVVHVPALDEPSAALPPAAPLIARARKATNVAPATKVLRRMIIGVYGSTGPKDWTVSRPPPSWF